MVDRLFFNPCVFSARSTDFLQAQVFISPCLFLTRSIVPSASFSIAVDTFTQCVRIFYTVDWLILLVTQTVENQFSLRALVGITKRKEWTSRDSSLLRFILTQTDCKYVQIITMFTPSANFNQLLAGLGFSQSESDEEVVKWNN